MNTAVIFVAIFGIAFCDPVSLKYDKCERLDVDATLEVTVTPEGSQPESKMVTTSMDQSEVIGGGCGANTRSMTIFFNETKSKMTLTFSIGADNTSVSLMTMFTFDAAVIFPDKNLTDSVVLTQAQKLELSQDDESYQCSSELQVNLDDPKNVYKGNLMMKGLRVQAYNLPASGDFSKAEVCPEDEQSTVDPTESTTQADVTTEETTSKEPTTAETTTSMAPATTTEAPTANTYTVKDGNETCLKMMAAISLSVNYKMTDNKTNTVKFEVPKDAQAEGMCGNGTDTNATLTVMIDDGDMVEFMFVDKDKKAELNMVTLTVTLDATRFPNASDAGKTMNLTSNTPLAQTDDTQYYMCNAGETVKFDEGSMLVITDLKVQAFNLENGDFSKEGVDCPADKTTTTGSTTTAPVTTPKPKPSGPPVNNYNVSNDNGTCLMMKASLVLDIKYTSKDNKPMSKEVVIPANPMSNGTCGDTVETLTITPFEGWLIEMVFSPVDTVTVTEELDAVANYQLSNLTVTYMFDDNLPDSNTTGKTVTVEKMVNEFKAGVKGSYKCNANTTIDMNDDVSLKTSNFRYQAFQKNSTDFNSGNLEECTADIETNSVVPIAVGAALAALVVIVLIAYLIGRRKSRRQGYESV